MIEKLLVDLRTDGYQMSDKVFMDGFSAGATFSQKFAILHPDRVQAIAVGHCAGSLTLPVSEYEDTELDWPVGINDYKSLVGYEFDIETYKKIPQFIYIGDQDLNNSNLLIGNWIGSWRNNDQVLFLINTFGKTDPIRLQNQVEFFKNKRV